MRLLVICLLIATLAGCTSAEHDMTGGGVSQGERSLNKDCGTTGTLHGDFGGAGTANIRVQDGAQLTIYENRVDGAGGESFQANLRGVAGTWTLTVSFGDGYSGGWHLDLDC